MTNDTLALSHSVLTTKMSYPPAPWTIKGFGLLNLHLVDVDRVRSLIPNQFELVSVFPDKTVGGVFVASYGAGSTLVYNELIIVAGLVSYQGQFGSWISHIYVDNLESVAGGREIWGLPKEFAQFKWNLYHQPSVEVTQDDRPLCSLACQWRSPGFPIPPIAAPVLSTQATIPMQFWANGQFNLQVSGTKVNVPAASPFAHLNLGQPWLSFYSDRLEIKVDAPKIIN